ncbi:MAG: AI-2E family transporter, partial [Clostridiales bacterium]|nr:AI-2E family transporter [Clostridiales bacterium]
IEGFNEKLAGFIQNGAGTLLGSTVHIVSSVVSTVVSGIIAFVFAIYVLAQKERLQRQSKRVLEAYVPEKYRNMILKVCGLLKTNFTNFITGQCLDALILGALFVIVLSVLRMPYALMIGVIIAFTALIPIVGAFLGCAVGVILILMVNPVKVLYFLIVFIILQQMEGKLIYPKIVGGSVGLPAIWVLVAIATGGSLFGVVGMLVFIPLVSTAYTLLKEDVNRRCSNPIEDMNGE